MTSFDYFREWLRGESAAAWAQCLLATMTLAATFVVANLPIWAQAKAAGARQTQLEGALIALTWRVGGLAQSLVNQIADPLKRPKLAKNEHVMLMEPTSRLPNWRRFRRSSWRTPWSGIGLMFFKRRRDARVTISGSSLNKRGPKTASTMTGSGSCSTTSRTSSLTWKNSQGLLA